MIYITPIELLDAPGPEVLGQVAAPLDMPPVTGALMRLTIEGGDRSAFTTQQVEAADEALDKINSVLTEVDGIIDGYLASRPYDLPLPIVPPILRAYARDLVTARLYRDGAPDLVLTRGRAAEKFLQMLADGKVTLGATDETHQGADVEVTKTDDDRTFTKESLHDFVP